MRAEAATAWSGVELPPERAHLACALCTQVFGYTYTDARMYDPAVVASLVRSREVALFAVLDGHGQPRALAVLRFLFPGRRLAEVGLLLVDPSLAAPASARALHLLLETMRAGVRALAREEGLRALVALDTTWHRLTQRLTGRYEFVETGVYLAWAPAWSERLRVPPHERLEVRDRRGPGDCRRRAEVVAVRALATLCEPYRVTLPRRFEAPLRALYGALRLPVELVPPGPAQPGPSTFSARVDPAGGRAVVALTAVGADARDAALDRLAHYRHGLVDVIHVVLPLGPAAVDHVVDGLLAEGCRYGALLPFHGRHDGLVLQYVNGPDPGIRGADLVSPATRALLCGVIGVDSPGAAAGR